LGTAKTITFLTNSLIIIWREEHVVHVARNLLLVEFRKIRGTQNFGRKQSYLKVAKKSIVNDQKLKKFLQPKKWSTMTRSYVTVAVTTPKKGRGPRCN
jgi:hypothetical protein